MTIGLKGFNFASIQSRIDAARSLQDAGQDDKVKDILGDLCRDILNEIHPTQQSIKE